MKSLILKSSVILALLSLVFWSCNKTETSPNTINSTSVKKQEVKMEFQSWRIVGEMVNDLPQLTIDKSQILENYTNNLFQISNIQGNFTDVSIIELSDGSFSMVFLGEVYSSAFYVKSDQSGKLKAFSGTSCTTSDCSSELLGCIVKYESDLAYCSPCSNGGTCTKTSSSSSLF